MGVTLRYLALSFTLSAFIFLAIFHIIGISTIKDSATKNEETWHSFVDCSKKLSSFECIDKIESNAKGDNYGQLSISIGLLRSQLGVGFIFDLIYTLLFLCLFVQTYLLFYSIGSKKINIKYFTLADWTINSAPLLGVLGTIASFVVVISNSDSQDMQQLFKNNFSIAAITTILGGFIYIINLFFLFLINQHFSED
ncbi:MAG: hypothetical protein BWK73_33250 [Thiothrix lacustris]|uniref:MotA/TolQ/ExbB proton channel domain-containing protein n=1 Tax=Thiothrix lacustris TaxID=525917 RepID=A0A1Y1QH14_9GAMM|nr:MAG: hypothetical protein BWK73_33250 [Thiothrix lacustris]